MGILTNKRLLLGVTGGIAAYKSADTVRRLREAGAEVRVVMTAGAAEFITALTLQAVSGHPVYQHLLDTDAEAGMGHIELARWADAVLVAPASANFMARLAQGRADDLLSAVCLATESPVAVAPAMNQQMWSNAATQANLAALKKNGVRIFGPAEGSQACGEVGPGRMLEPAELVTSVAGLFSAGELDGLRVVITAGPTWEAIDPVRGLTNRSSGKMGYAVAQAAMEAGAKVTLISGPTALPDPERVHTIRVESAQEMHDAVLVHIADADIFIGVAAVADYRPTRKAKDKIKKADEKMTLDLERTPDILASVAARKPAPFTVGFAAETENLEQHARQKLETKRLDLVAANRVGADLGFGMDENSLLLVEPGAVTELPMQPKAKLARALIAHVAARYRAKHSAKVHTLRRP
ncbi:MAG TPA: bifunctional phosphopantothenoylcysteine decarboxylase/phosphopantothenate--cysteine ligase CoaBC [Sulfuricaulis sp.]|nr:bifunctional phosphopantothenoylcysteine decarboxylase/phosphopantothenate--cysteine ligase CoaBC [Sulfuricaulis sp.]